jgi:glutamate-1-semialdehyde 2,1-aminomutase
MDRSTPGASSSALFARAQHVIPGGVNSPVRAFRAVGGEPIFVRRGKGSRIWTVDGAELVDFCGSWGPLLLGHARDEVVAAVAAAAADGASFGIGTEREVEFAELLCALIPSSEMVRLVSSGTEAVMTALRLARGFTGRRRIVKFDGCYHGHSDAMLVAAGSGLLTGGIASSAGVPPGITGDVFVLPFNNPEAVRALFAQCGQEIAAVIVEPVAGNMGLVPPAEGFLAGLRDQTARWGAVLIFDEVITGFRFAPTAYAAVCGVTPDLLCLGKIIGGGLPLGAVSGRRDIMNKLAPLGPVYQAGTLSGNPVAVAAGLATLRLLQTEQPYARIAELGRVLAEGLTAAARSAGVPLQCARIGGVFTPFFTGQPVRNLADAKTCDTAAYGAFFRWMLKAGFYLPPAQFEVGFVSAAHTPDEILAFCAAAADALKERGRP